MSETLLDRLDIRSSALIVIDLQNAFCHPDGTLGRSGLNATHLGSVIGPIRTVVERCQAAGMPVLWTVQEHFETDRRRGRKRLPAHTSKRKGISALAGTWDAAIVDELADLAQDPTLIIRKHRFGGFYETRLQIVLEMLGVDALFITGLTTNACVETTIREAYLRDFDVIAVSDCIAGVDRGWEETAQEVWRQYFAITCASPELLAWVERQQMPRAVAIHHLLLKVRDIALAKGFYIDLLGFTARPDAKPLADGRPFISTMQGLGMTAGGPDAPSQVDHLAFRVSGLDALNARLKEARVPFERELGPGPYGRAIYVRDPDGNVVELFE